MCSLGGTTAALLLDVLGIWRAQPLHEQLCQHLLQVWVHIYSTIIPETPMPQVFSEINQECYGVISLLECTFRFTLSSMCPHQHKKPNMTLESQILFSLINWYLYICLSSVRFFYIQSSIYSIGKTILDRLCKYTFSLGEEWNSVVESKKYHKFYKNLLVSSVSHKNVTSQLSA